MNEVGLEFDTWLDDYTAKINRWVPYYSSMLEALLAAVEKLEQPPQRILDLGCGNGNLAAELLKRFPDAEYTLLDASQEMVTACQKRFADFPKVKCQVGFFQTVDFEAQSFDLVLAVLSLHHLKAAEKQAFFQKMRAWLLPQAAFYCADLFIDKNNAALHSDFLVSWEQQARKAGTNEQEWAAMMEHHRLYDFPDAFAAQRTWLQAAEFERLQVLWEREEKWYAWEALPSA